MQSKFESLFILANLSKHLFFFYTIKNIENLKIVTCHLGQGASITAVRDGKSIDTSMGLSPVGGIAMVTRSGDLDPSVVLDIMEK